MNQSLAIGLGLGAVYLGLSWWGFQRRATAAGAGMGSLKGFVATLLSDPLVAKYALGTSPSPTTTPAAGA